MNSFAPCKPLSHSIVTHPNCRTTSPLSLGPHRDITFALSTCEQGEAEKSWGTAANMGVQFGWPKYGRSPAFWPKW